MKKLKTAGIWIAIAAALIGIVFAVKYFLDKKAYRKDYFPGYFTEKDLKYTDENDNLIDDIDAYNANRPSDIDGWSVQDKLKAGLLPRDGADTDGDGLTDKEEIEIYGSDPLKMSTAGDMYTDKEKIDKGLEITKKIVDSDISYPNNQVAEVELSAANAKSKFAYVVDDTETLLKHAEDESDIYHFTWMDRYTIYKSYAIEGFEGNIRIDLSGLLTQNIAVDDIEIIYGDKAMWMNVDDVHIKYDIAGSCIEISGLNYDSKKDGGYICSHHIVIVSKEHESRFIGRLKDKFGKNNTGKESAPLFSEKIDEDFTGHFIADCNRKNKKEGTGEKTVIYYVPYESESKNKGLIAHAESYIHTDSRAVAITDKEFKKRLRTLRRKTMDVDKYNESGLIEGLITEFFKYEHEIPKAQVAYVNCSGQAFL